MSGEIMLFDENTVFKSLSRSSVPFHQLFGIILDFILADLKSSYKISIGTDSQVRRSTVIVSCIHVHRIGKGAIGFLHKHEMPRPLRNLHEKIFLETCTTLQLAHLFDDTRIEKIYTLLGDKVDFEFHIDIGSNGRTKALINEMVGMVQGLNFVPKIKPDSYCASSFADKYTKAM